MQQSYADKPEQPAKRLSEHQMPETRNEKTQHRSHNSPLRVN